MFLVIWIYALYSEQAFAQERVNLALNMPASQSTSEFDTNAEMANDGNKIMQFFSGTCSHTDLELVPWWTVDLKGDYFIHSLRIFNRDELDCALEVDLRCTDRLAGFRVHVSDDVNSTTSSTRFKRLCYADDGITAAAIIDVNCTSPVVGRYVTISVNLTSPGYLTLCEVEVYGFQVPTDSAVPSTSGSTHQYVEQSATTSFFVLDTDEPVSTSLMTTSLQYTLLDTQTKFKTPSPLYTDSVTVSSVGNVFFNSHVVTVGNGLSPSVHWMETSTCSGSGMTTYKEEPASTGIPEMTPSSVISMPTSPTRVFWQYIQSDSQALLESFLHSFKGTPTADMDAQAPATLYDATNSKSLAPGLGWTETATPCAPEMTRTDGFSVGVGVPETSSSTLSFKQQPGETEEFTMSTISEVSNGLEASRFSTEVKMCCCLVSTQIHVVSQNSDSFMTSVLKDLEIDRKNLTKQRGKYMSMSDDRASSAAISVSFMVVALSLCGLIFCDVKKILRDVKVHWQR